MSAGRRRPVAAGLAAAAIAAAVVGFAGGWPGEVLSDGPGVRMFVRMAVESRAAGSAGGGAVPYWLDGLWAGTPAWALGPFFTIAWIVPLAERYGVERGFELATLAGQILGGWGTLVLARSLWQRVVPSALAGFLYALSPMVIGHATLFGLGPLVWVFAAIPWFAWAYRHALVDGSRWIAVSGAVAAFALLQQAEHAYALALLGAGLTVVALAKAGTDELAATRGRILARAAGAALLAGALSAHWLLPFSSIQDAFVLTDPESARLEITEGGAAIFGASPQVFVKPELALLDDPSAFDLAQASFYLGVATVAAALAGVLLLRRDRDGWLTATACVAAVALWLSTGGIALAEGTLRTDGAIAFTVIGFVAGVLLGVSIRRLATASRRRMATIAAVGALFVFPLFAPFLALQDVVPLLETLRFPRFYPVALVGVCLVAAWPVCVAADGAARWLPRTHGVLSTSLALLVAGLVLIDLAPYRDFYGLHVDDEFAEGSAELREWAAALPDSALVGTQMFDRPALVERLQQSSVDLAVGWPHPIAGAGVWHLTGETYHASRAYARRAMGVLGTTHLVSDPDAEAEPGEIVVGGYRVTSNDQRAPRARVYDRVVVTADRALAGRLAPSLAQQGVAVVASDDDIAIEGVTVVTLPDAPCPRIVDAVDSQGLSLAGVALASEVARACSIGRFIGLPNEPTANAELRRTVTVEADALLDRLDGIALDLDRPPGPATVSVRRVLDDGFGPILATVRSEGADADGLWRFRFPAIEQSGGARFAFTLACPDCGRGGGPRLRTSPDLRALPDVAVAGDRVPGRVANAVALYDAAPTPGGAPATPAEAERVGNGSWRVETPRSGLLVLAAAHFPGWTASNDADVVEADSGLVGVEVREAGTVDLAWSPPNARDLGRAVSIAAVLLALAMVLRVDRVLARRRGAHGHGLAPDEQPLPRLPLRAPVSVVVATHNDGDNIGRLVHALLDEEDVVEVIVVASGCTDDTVAQVLQLAAAPDGRAPVRLVIEDERTGKANALNLGFAQARASFVLAASGDVLPERGVIAKLVQAMGDPAVGMAGGRPVPVNDPAAFVGHAVGLLWRLHHRMAMQRPKLGEMVLLRTGVAARLPLTSVDEACMQALVEAAGYRSAYVPDAVVFNRGPETVRDFLAQRRRIHGGHLALEDDLDYLTPSLHVWPIARDLVLELASYRGRDAARRIVWSLATVGLEAMARALAHVDLLIGRENHVWSMVETAKGPARSGDPRRARRSAGVPEVGTPPPASGERDDQHELPVQLHVRDVQRVRAQGEGADRLGVGAGVHDDGDGAGLDDVQRG